MKLNFLSLCLSALILLASCKKENLPTTGSNQNNSNYSSSAHVITSDWVSASLIWSDATAASDNSLRANWGAAVTQEMIDNGAVLIYAKDHSSGSVKPLPALFDVNDTEFDSYSSEVEPYSIQLVHSSYRNDQYITPIKNDNISFRYILIENAANGYIETSSAVRFSIGDLKHMSYEEVAVLLDINR